MFFDNEKVPMKFLENLYVSENIYVQTFSKILHWIKLIPRDFFFFQFAGSKVKETFLKVPETKTINKTDNIKGVKTCSL